MPISFNDVPTNVRVPFVYVEFDNSRAVQGLAQMPYKTLIIGQRLAAGTVAELVPTRVTSAAQAQGFFGQGSMLAAMCARQIQNDPLTETIAIALDDAVAAVAATGNVLIGGAMSAGTINFYIAGQRVRVGVATGDTAANVATALAAAIQADADLPVSAVVNGVTAEQVDLTAKNLGEAANDIDLRHSYYSGEGLPTGVTFTITAMTGGTGNPDIADIWAVLGDEHYHVITMAYSDAANLTVMEAELLDRWGPLRMIEGVAITAATGTHAELGTLGDSRNSQHTVIMHCHGSPTPPWEMAAAVAGKVAYHGNIDQARPFQTLTLDGVMPPKEVDRFDMNENNLLLYDGISTFKVTDGGVVFIQRLITTYKTNAQGAEDISFLDLNTILTLGYLRYDFRNLILRKYPRHKLANDGTNFGQGQAVITPKVGKAEAIARFQQWELKGLVEGMDQFKKDIIVERNLQDPNRLDFMLPPDLMNQFRVGGVQIGFLL